MHIGRLILPVTALVVFFPISLIVLHAVPLFALLAALVFLLLAALLVLITPNTCVCDGSREPHADNGRHAADDDRSIYQSRQEPQS
jgi:hypothetical protein